MKHFARLFGPKIDASLTKTGLQLSMLLFFTNISMPVQAETFLTGGYSGLQFATSEIVLTSSTGSETQETNGHIKFVLGRKLTSLFSIEGQLGLTTDSNDDSGIITYGGYLRADYDLGKCRLYGLVGVGGINAYNDIASDVSETSASYGVGIQLFGTEDLALTFEYVSMLDTDLGSDDVTMESIGFGFTYYFNEDNSRPGNNDRAFGAIRQ